VRDGECRGLYITEKIAHNKITQEAIARSKEIQGQPVIIHNDEVSFYIIHIGLKGWCDYFKGLVCNTSTKKWEWADGSPVDYKPPVHYPELDADCKTGCGWLGTPDGEWRLSCDDVVADKEIFCTTQLKQPSGDGCDSFDDDDDDVMSF
ncbi:hypothetical protein PENTCL1PPCAC_19426, partial [Pristionchus entomophagus]